METYYSRISNPIQLGPHKLSQRPPVIVQCPRKEKEDSNIITFLGINKLYARNNSIVLKIFWFLVLALSISLCTWQVVLCFDKFFSKPIDTNVKIEVFNDIVFPAITICPQTLKFGHEFDKKFEQLCSNDDECNKLDDNGKSSFPFKKLGTNIEEMWLAREIKNLTIEANCIYAVNEPACDEFTRKFKYPSTKDHFIDTLVGRCLTFQNDDKWYFAGKSAWTWWIDVTKIDLSLATNPQSSLDVAIHTSPIADKLSIPSNHIKSFNKNHIGISMIEFKYLNSSRRPCITENERVECMNDCVNKKFATMNAPCKWPFLDSNLPYCESQEKNEELREKLIQLKFTLAECKCKRACQSYTYAATTTFYISAENEMKNTTTIGMVLDGNTKQVVTEFYSYPGTSLVADLGGSIGLFLGISLLSIFELIYAGSKKVFK